MYISMKIKDTESKGVTQSLSYMAAVKEASTD